MKQPNAVLGAGVAGVHLSSDKSTNYKMINHKLHNSGLCITASYTAYVEFP